MQRPVMNPTFLDDEQPRPVAGPPRWRRIARLVVRFVKLLFTDVFAKKERIVNEVGTPFSRFTRAVLYRLMFVPLVLAALVTLLVVSATHPHPPVVITDPTSQGLYYDPVELLSLDNTKLEGWLVPVMDAHRIVVEKDQALQRKHPAVVLVHDFGTSRQQVLPLIVPLHEAGFVVLAINLRGHGPSSSTGSTFGLNESQDVRAAVEMLRRRTFVASDAIGVLGIGTGATAALLAAEQDPHLNTLILDHPLRQFQDVLDDRIGPRHAWLSWVRPMCKWAFEIAYKVDADDVDLTRFAESMKRNHVLMLDEPGETLSCVKPVRNKQAIEFLRKHLNTRHTVAHTPRLRETVTQIDADSVAPAESWPPQRSANQLFERLQK